MPHKPLTTNYQKFGDGTPRRTYREIFRSMSDEQLDQTPTIYIDGEYLPAEALVTDEADALDENCVYFQPVDE